MRHQDRARKIMRGDRWSFQTNRGIIERDIKSITRDGTVSYVCMGRFRQCSRAAFRRWLHGATLEYRDPRVEAEIDAAGERLKRK